MFPKHCITLLLSGCLVFITHSVCIVFLLRPETVCQPRTIHSEAIIVTPFRGQGQKPAIGLCLLGREGVSLCCLPNTDSHEPLLSRGSHFAASQCMPTQEVCYLIKQCKYASRYSQRKTRGEEGTLLWYEERDREI